MPVLNSQMFFLGNFADLDSDETNTITEAASGLLGAYAQPPLISVAVDDTDGDNAILDDEMGTTSEDFTYDAGGGVTSALLDSTQTYMADVLLGDGSVSTIEVTVIQLQNGDVFLTDFLNSGTLDNLNIQSIELVSVTGSDYVAFFADSSVDNSAVVCFTPGTLIDTSLGAIPVEKLRPGHFVRTLDHGFQPVCWVGCRRLRPADLAAHPHLRPVIIRKGSLGNTRRLRVSPQHGFLMDGQLIRARHLAEFFGGKVARVDHKCERVTYIHFLCEQHEIVFAEGCATETLYPGPVALRALHRDAIAELVALFPDLSEGADSREAVEAGYGCPARSYVTGRPLRAARASGEIRRGRAVLPSEFPGALTCEGPPVRAHRLCGVSPLRITL